eukprot:7264820-Alexandrium_andersonii.AAC.1
MLCAQVRTESGRLHSHRSASTIRPTRQGRRPKGASGRPTPRHHARLHRRSSLIRAGVARQATEEAGRQRANQPACALTRAP